MGIDRLLEIMAALRTPGSGCAWDLQQTHRTLVPYAIEEAYELADAVARDDADDIRDELGDCLLQVVFHARVAEEAGRFAFADVADAICAKLVRRHPHVRLEGAGDCPDARPSADGGPANVGTADVRTAWEAAKAEEREKRRAGGLLAGVPTALPGLTRAVKLQARAATAGFDWDDASLILDKVREEVDEVEAELDGDASGLLDEIGDLLFAVGNLARRADIDPEAALRCANAKFERRFAFIEEGLSARGSSPAQATLAEMEELWTEAKRRERAALQPTRL